MGYTETQGNIKTNAMKKTIELQGNLTHENRESGKNKAFNWLFVSVKVFPIIHSNVTVSVRCDRPHSADGKVKAQRET